MANPSQQPQGASGEMYHGWLALDKPYGMSSAQAVARVKRLLGRRDQKIGHGGTLDPLATGILPIALGHATKTVPYVMDASKAYEFTLSFGQQRDTDDAEGCVTAESSHRPSWRDLQALLPQLRGEQLQVPPAFSAIKQQGQRAYEAARAGKVMELAARLVRVEGLEFCALTADGSYLLCRLRCGKGTYVRALGRDIAAQLGSCGHISFLRRIFVGRFDERRAISLAQLEKLVHNGQLRRFLYSMADVLDALERVELNEEQFGAICQGRQIRQPRLYGRALPLDGTACYAVYGGAVVALGVYEEGRFIPRRVMVA